MRRFCAILIGLVFFTSGLFKLIDPVGTSLIVKSYLEFFHFGFLSGLSTVLGFALSLVESINGLALLAGAYRRLSALVTIGLTAFFTLVTLILMIAQPEMDCGCFGEAFHLTHTQTFIKNLILCGLVAGAFIPVPKTSARRNIFLILGAVTLLVGVYSQFFLPLWDFTDFSAGDRLYDTTHPFPPQKTAEPGFIYEKDGLQKEFTLDELPDSTWIFVAAAEMPKADTPSNLIPITAPDGAVCDSVLLHGKVVAISVYEPGKMSSGDWQDAAGLLKSSASCGMRPVLLAASASEELEKMLENLRTEDKIQLLMVTYFSDHKVLMTFNRSNGGVTVLDEGLIVEKWSANNYPSDKKLQKTASENPGNLIIQASVPGRNFLCAFMILAICIALYTYRKRI